MDGPGVKGAKGGGVKDLRQDQDAGLRHEGADQQPAQRRQGQAHQQDAAGAEALQQPVHDGEDQHLHHHPPGPERADEVAGIAGLGQVDRVEGIVDPMAGLHQETGQQKGGDLGPAQDLQDGGAVLDGAGLHRALEDQQAGEPDPHLEPQGDDRHHATAQTLHQRPQDQHRQDEADGAPEADAGIAPQPRPQVIDGHHLHLWQGCIPEETEDDHRQGHLPETPHGEDGREGKPGQQGGQPHDGHAATGTVGQPAPDVGSDDLGTLQDGHQLADGQGRIAQVLEVQPPEGQHGPQGGEIEEVEAGESPVRHGGGLALGQASGNQVPARAASGGAPGWTSAFCPR